MLHNARHGPPPRKPQRPGKRRRVTLIAAFRCYEGVVLCADSQETIDVPGYGQYRVSVNKLDPRRAGDYEFVVGGSGDGDLVEEFTTSLTESIIHWPRFNDDTSARRAIKRVLINFYREDVAASHATDDDKRLSFLICLKHKDDGNVSLWRTSSVSVKRAGDFELVGWEEPIFWHEAARLYQPNWISNHAMLLGIHLFAIAKVTSNVVSGDTKVILARDNGIRVIDSGDVKDLEEMLRTFNKMVDELRLILPNMSIPFDEFRVYVLDFKDKVIEMHQSLLGRSVEQSISQALANPNWTGDPYPKIPLGHKVRVTMTNVDEPSKKIAIDVPFEKMFPPDRASKTVDLGEVKLLFESE